MTVALLLAFAVTATACGGSSAQPAHGTAATAPVTTSAGGTTSATTTHATTGVRTLVIDVPADALTMDPAIESSTATGIILVNMFDSLLKIEADGKIVPDVATAVKQDDPTTWTIKLRDGVKFTDGEPVDAQAVKYTLDRILNPATKSPQRAHYDNFTSVKVVDPHTIQIKTKAPDSLFKVRLANLLIVPPKYIQKHGEAYFARHPVGSGPYLLKEWVRDSHITMVANPDYWGPNPPFQTVKWNIVPEEATRIANLQTGSADIIKAVSPNEAMVLKANNSFKVEAKPSSRVMVIAFNIKKHPADMLAFRKAVAYAVDPQAIVKALFRGVGATVIPSVLSPVVPHFPQDAVKPYPYDPAQAKKILDSAGLANVKVNFQTTAKHFPQDEEVAQAISGQLKKAGIQATVQPLQYGVFFANWEHAKESPFYLAGDGNIWWDPEPQIKAFFQTGGILSSYSNASLDKAITTASAQTVPSQRSQAFGDVLRMIHDQFAAVPLYAVNYIYGVDGKVAWQPRPDNLIYVMDMKPTAK